jgi:hypothetical protein
MGYIHTKINHKYNLVEDQYGVSDELLNWLKDSCIKTKAGKDLVCYHGSPSNEQFAVFNDNTAYGCKSFIGFFSLDREFAECYTDDGEDSSYSRVRSFVVNSRKLFDIKNPTCIRFLKARLPNAINCCGDILDKTSFINYLKTEQMQINNYKLDVSNFNNLKMFDKIGMSILGDSGWNYSCTLESDKQLQNKPFLGVDPKNNSVYVLDHNNCIKPNIDNSYYDKDTEGVYLYLLSITFDKAISAGILTTTHLNSLSQGQPVNIKLSAEEFIKVCNYGGYSGFTEKDRQTLHNIISDPAYDNLDLSVNVRLIPQKINLDEFCQGMDGGYTVKKVDSTWELYEDSYCIVDNQKIHILDWLKSEGFDAVVVKEDWAVNIICLYKNMIKDLKNKMPTDSDNVFENYHYSDALLIDIL